MSWFLKEGESIMKAIIQNHKTVLKSKYVQLKIEYTFCF